MITHRFTVNVPNPESRSVTVDLSLRAASASDLRELMLQAPKGKLEIAEAWISLNPCESGKPRLRRRLKAHASIDAHVTVLTGPASNPAVGGTTALHLTDRREGKTVGGVMLVCVDPPVSDAPGQVVSARSPCPVELARGLYTVETGADPSGPGPMTISSGATVDLVAQLTNPRKRSLNDVTAYLEHLGTSDADFVPVAWNVGTLPPGEIFYATWRVSAVGSFAASIVVDSKGAEPTRLSAPIRIAPPGEKPRKPRRRRSETAQR